MTANTIAKSTDRIEKAVTKILEKHKFLLEGLVMSSADKWVAIDELITQAARETRTTKKVVMIQIGITMNKENLDGYVRSLKVMISRAKAKLGIIKKISRKRKKGFEAILERLEKSEFTVEQLERLFTLLENKGGILGHNRGERLPIPPGPVQAGVVSN